MDTNFNISISECNKYIFTAVHVYAYIIDVLTFKHKIIHNNAKFGISENSVCASPGGEEWYSQLYTLPTTWSLTYTKLLTYTNI